MRDSSSQMNRTWDRVCSLLQDVPTQGQFQSMSHALLLMLENVDRRKSKIVTIKSSLDPATLQDHHKQLVQIKQELLKSPSRVASLQATSHQLLVNAEGSDCLGAKEKVHVIGNRLKLLLKEVSITARIWGS